MPKSRSLTSPSCRVAIVGGGASGYFAALRCADLGTRNGVAMDVHIFEATNSELRKVRISGGGRCNVTHGIFEPRLFCENYPRGQKELLSPFHQFQSSDTVAWFRQRGIALKVEADGRMFPESNSSETVIDCFQEQARALGVQLHRKASVKTIRATTDGLFSLRFAEGPDIIADKVVLATGSMPSGYRLAEAFGHQITERAPSLFTFKIAHPLLQDLAGTSFSNAALVLKTARHRDFKQQGPLLITHWGLSGPALLKLSAWAAREMKRVDYKAQLVVNWLGLRRREDVLEALQAIRSQSSRSHCANQWPEGLTKKFWLRVLDVCGVPGEKPWGESSKKDLNKLTSVLFESVLDVDGKSRFKEEFVECGGVALREIHFSSMESKIQPGLYVVGEILDVDGITGGFNFQNAWTTAWLAGSHIAQPSRHGEKS